jgi:HNH endonuclease
VLPLSFTKNIGGLQNVYGAIRSGYTPGISIGKFRKRCGLGPDRSLIATEFFLCTQVRDGQEHVLGDTLIAETLSQPTYSRLLARLYFFAVNLNMPGERLTPEHRQAGAMQNYVIREHAFVGDGLRRERFEKDQSLEPLIKQIGDFSSPVARRKWVNNYYFMAEQCGFVLAPDGHLETFADTWGALALRLFFERYVATNPTADVGTLVSAALAAEIHKLLGVSHSWLDGRLEGAAEMFLSNQVSVFEGFDETEAERNAARRGLPAPSPGGEAKRRESVVKQIIRRGDNRRFLQDVYGGECQLSGIRLILPDGSCSVDCAHIRPLGAPHSGPDDVTNMLSIAPTMHRLFDRGCVRIDPETHAIRLLHGNAIPHLPQLRVRSPHTIGKGYLAYHAATILKERLS